MKENFKQYLWMLMLTLVLLAVAIIGLIFWLISWPFIFIESVSTRIVDLYRDGLDYIFNFDDN